MSFGARMVKLLPMRIRSVTSLVLLVASAVVACGGAVPEAPEASDESTVASEAKIAPGVGRPRPPRPHTTFTIRGLGDRCWDFGAGGRVVGPLGTAAQLAPCRGTPAQSVVVQEIDAHHDVALHVGSMCLGVAGAGLRGGVAVGKPLVLQACSATPTSTQRFALDGDAVLMGHQADGADVARQLVIEPLGDVTRVGTPLVVGTRDVNDAEYFRFVASNGPNVRPHGGFVRLAPKPNESDDDALDAALALGWGTVIEVDRSLVLQRFDHGFYAGTTLRGERKAREQGPEIAFTAGGEGTVFVVAEDHVRITGLRLRGPSRSTSGSLPVAYGIKVLADPLTDVLVDHVDASDWPGAALDVRGADTETQEHAFVCGGPSNLHVCTETVPAQQCKEGLPLPRPSAVRAIGNFIHHNEREGIGYGLAVGEGGFMLARGNVMYQNRHSIAADGTRTTGYVAHDNFVLSNSPGYGTFGGNHEHDFDKHGTFDRTHWVGGVSGDWVDFGWNTFLGTDRQNINERGTPCRQTEIHDNVFLQSKEDAFTTRNTDPSKDVIGPNQFSLPNPTADLAVGDFDGDDIDDVFVGTGATWWYSSGGVAEWRLLNRMPEHASELRFGDFDGDGRSDVVTIHNGLVDVSWAGVSPWQSVNAAAWSVDDLAVGDFDGDHLADLFLATGTTWFVAPHANGSWQSYATSSFRTWDLRFGDFDADGKTDVFGVTDNQWQYVPGGTASWVPLRTALTRNVVGLVVADFDGDGYADIGRKSGSTWQYAARGWGGFVTLRNTSDPLVGQPIGRFDAGNKADVLVWGDRHFRIASGARDPVVTWSRQDMK
jgi:hypothetical protein